jgi:catechol 2,3-dioxygenase-like lactoylglutathione lyase family enzyme
MFNHVMVGTNDIDESVRFYDAILGALGFAPGVKDSEVRCTYRGNGGVFMIKTPINGEPATNGNGSTIGFAANDSATVDAWHASGVANGGTTCEDPPGMRASGVYLAYLRDPSGNKVCAAHRTG